MPAPERRLLREYTWFVQVQNCRWADSGHCELVHGREPHLPASADAPRIVGQRILLKLSGALFPTQGNLQVSERCALQRPGVLRLHLQHMATFLSESTSEGLFECWVAWPSSQLYMHDALPMCNHATEIRHNRHFPWVSLQPSRAHNA